MSITESLRATVNRFGIDVCRIGRARLGRNLALDLAALAPKDGLIFDVGANTGRAARFFCKHFPASPIWSFEPAREAFEALSSAPDLSRVRKYKLALGDHNGEATLNLFQGSELNSLLPRGSTAERYIDSRSFAQSGTEKVQTARLDTFCRQNHVAEIGILKIDTQGFDLHVLRGAEGMLTAGKIHVVQVEVNFSPLYQGQPTFSEILEFLSRFGFGFVGLYDVSRDNQGCIKWCDGLFRLNRLP